MKLSTILLSLLVNIFLYTTTIYTYQEVQVLSPADLSSQFPNGLITASPALFGIPDYQTTIHGQVLYAVDANGQHTLCSTLDKQKTGFDKLGSMASVILLVDRGGGCTFTQKVRIAENSGAVVSVIAVDDRDEWAGRLPLMADDGTGSKIAIPSVLISKQDGDKIKNVLNVPDSKDSSKMTKVSISLTYRLPAPDNRVEIDLWTSSFDQQSRIFKRNFGPAIKALGEHVLFTPHYYIVPGDAFGCDLPGMSCGNQCTNNGKYCTWDPERDVSRGLSGAQVLEEDLRRICIYKALNNTNIEKKQLYKWFDYVNKFDDDCTDTNNWSEACSYKVIENIGIDLTNVKQCIVDSGGLTGDKNNEFELQRQDLEDYGGTIIRIPWLLINSAPAYGSIQCMSPLSQATCAPLNGICHGFADGTAPQPCTDINYDYECTYDGYLPNPPQNMCSGSQPQQHKLSWSSVFGIILLVMFICGCVAIGAYVYIKREKEQMRQDIDDLLKQYLPLSESDTISSRHHNGKYEQRERLLDQQVDDEV